MIKATKITDLKKELENSVQLKQEFQNNPIKFLENIQTDEPPIKDKGVFLFVVAIVGIVLIGSLVLGSIIIFTSNDYSTVKVPEFIVMLGSTALGAMVGLLAPSPSSTKSS